MVRYLSANSVTSVGPRQTRVEVDAMATEH